MVDNIDRRKALKLVGGGIVGGTTLVGTARAGDTGDERRQDSFAWAQNDLYEMLDTESENDDEGDEEAHRTLWLIASMAGTGVDGAEHSPHPNPPDRPIDHVVPLEGPSFTAQWHVHEVRDSESGELVRKADGKYLTSASRIQNATSVDIVPTPIVFTCPIRPHKHK